MTKEVINQKISDQRIGYAGKRVFTVVKVKSILLKISGETVKTVR
jgi:hypothetical protein